MINNLGTLSSEMQINFGVLQTNTENSATEVASSLYREVQNANFFKNINIYYKYIYIYIYMSISVEGA